MSNKAVFLDRDGTLNIAITKKRRPYPPASPKEFEILPGVKDAIKILKNLNYIPVVITNQPDFARGKTTLSEIEELNKILRHELNIEHIYMCLHDDDDKCPCRKPKEGLLLIAAADLDIDIEGSIMVGDRWRDILAGQKAGCTCYFIDNNYDETQPAQPFHAVSSLLEVAYKIRSSHGF
jgi:D-glycero-D-manno-heptose 1,7-bisphosphate phosphatase